MEAFKGIIWHRDNYARQFIAALRNIGMLGSFVIVLYALLAYYELIPTQTHEPIVLLIIIAVSLYLMIRQYFDRRPNLVQVAIRLIIFHLLVSATLIFIAGFQSPVLIGWPLLLTLSYLYFGRTAYLQSLTILLCTALLDVVLNHDSSLDSVLLNTVAVGICIFAGTVIAWIAKVYISEHTAFQRSRASENLQRERIISLVNSIGDAILNTDPHGVIRTYNAASLDLFDTNESLNGKKLDDVLALYDKDDKKVALFKSLENTKSVTIREDLSYKFADGERLRLSINCSPVRSSFGDRRTSRDGYIFIMRDITKSKSLEEERDEFISVVSHELRTPITIAEATVSNAQILLDRGGAKEMMKEALENTHSQVLYLAKIVNDLSTLSRAERGVADEAETVQLDDLVHNIYHEYHPQAAVKKLSFDIDADSKLGSISVSRLYLEEVLQNFITNAIKYTHEGGVAVSVHRNKDKSVSFAVKDTGIGMSKSDQRHVFQKFFRSEDYRTRETSGTGLGLYIVKKLAQKLGTEIEFTSRLNHGSTFSFTLPAEPPVKRIT